MAGLSLDTEGVYCGTIGSSTAFLLHTAERNSLFDITNSLGDNPADSHAPESEFINDNQLLSLRLARLE
jgi:hypothetical protein